MSVGPGDIPPASGELELELPDPFADALFEALCTGPGVAPWYVGDAVGSAVGGSRTVSDETAVPALHGALLGLSTFHVFPSTLIIVAGYGTRCTCVLTFV